jgi:uncharacterized protein (TIGR02231 family)
MTAKRRKKATREGPRTHRAESKISAVTAYGDRAMVTRSAHLALDVGEGSVVVRGLPAALDEYSLRVAGSGPAKVRIMGVKIGRELDGRASEAQAEKARAALEKAEDERRALADKRDVVAERRRGVQALSEAATRDLAKTLARRRLDPAEAEGVVSFFYDDLGKSNAQLLKLDRALRDKDRELEKLRFAYEKHRAPRPREEKNAAVPYECSVGGEFELTLSYVMPNAGWEPTYDLRFDEGQKETEIQYRAAVFQNTGEDWNDVDLKLSTARPQAGAAPPELEPKYVDFYEPYVAAPVAAQAEAVARAGAVAAEEPGELLEAAVDLAPAAHYEAEHAEAAVEARGPAVTFVVPGLPSIPADGEPHVVTVGSHRFGGELAYVVVPEHAEAAYLQAKAANESEFTLLPGVANVFRGDEYVGRAARDLPVPGAELEYYLGADDRLKVEYDCQRITDDSSGLTGANRKITVKAETELANHTGAVADVVVKQRLPVALNKNVKVKMTEAKPKPTQKDDDGLLEWHLALKDGEKKKITFHYDVEFPKDRRIQGV